jgi:hypothetical protein
LDTTILIVKDPTLTPNSPRQFEAHKHNTNLSFRRGVVVGVLGLTLTCCGGTALSSLLLNQIYKLGESYSVHTDRGVVEIGIPRQDEQMFSNQLFIKFDRNFPFLHIGEQLP